MKYFELRYYHLLTYAMLWYCHHKLKVSNRALLFLRDNRPQIREHLFGRNRQLSQALSSVKEEPAVLMLNKHALNVTLNWLCNVVNFIGVHDRLIVFAFDRVTYDTLRKSWPRLRVVGWYIPVMEQRFVTGGGRYQMFQLFRASLSAFLVERKRNFWMIQPDTYWRENLFEIVDPTALLKDDANLLFDQEGSEGLLADMIAGGNFYVKAEERSAQFFSEVAKRLLHYFATDNNIMGGLCAYQFAGNKCAFIPYRLLSNWRWHIGNKRILPALMQFDGGGGPNGKLTKMHTLGAKFVRAETLRDGGKAECDPDISAAPKRAIPPRRLFGEGNDSNGMQLSIRISHVICEYLYVKFPSIGRFLRGVIFPYYAYFVVV